jgi:hypothetical protein
MFYQKSFTVKQTEPKCHIAFMNMTISHFAVHLRDEQFFGFFTPPSIDTQQSQAARAYALFIF